MKRLITLLMAFSLILMFSGTSIADLVAHYPFNGNAYDESGYGNDGTVYGATLTEDRCGNVDRAYGFDGEDDYIDCGTDSSLDLGTGDFTISGWIKPNLITHEEDPIVAKTLDNGSDGFNLVRQHGGAFWFCGEGEGFNRCLSNTALISTTVPVAGEWYHVVVVKHLGIEYIYVNGILEASKDSSGNSIDSMAPLYIGKIPVSGGYFAYASIDDVRIYNHALSQAEIEELYDQEGTCTVPPQECIPSPDDLISWWPGDCNAMDIIDGNDGILQDNATFAQGKVKHAFSLDGNGDYVDTGSASNLHVSEGDFTVDAWVKFDRLRHESNELPPNPYGPPLGDMSIVDKMSADPSDFPNGNGWRLLKQDDDRFWFCLGGRGVTPNGCEANSPLTVRSVTIAEVDVWYHVVGVKSSNVISIYVNGQLESQKVISGFYDDGIANLLIGAQGLQGAYFAGLVDEVEIHNRALSAEEIEDIYLADSAGKCKDSDDEGPVTSVILADPNPAAISTAIQLTANVDDSAKGVSKIASAEYSVDDVVIGNMDAQDGTFDAASEDVQVIIPAFTEAGVHNVCISGTDAICNIGPAECILLAIYDPEGGFVTGGGRIWSPQNAYTANPTLEGKAIFGFVSKYKNGATVPTGQTEFQFKLADLNFHSISYDWLVVTGSDYARFKGSGTINGQVDPVYGNYNFMGWAGDNDPDTFRIKIWTEDELGAEFIVYDNGMDQPIEGGSIVVHTK